MAYLNEKVSWVWQAISRLHWKVALIFGLLQIKIGSNYFAYHETMPAFLVSCFPSTAVQFLRIGTWEESLYIDDVNDVKLKDGREHTLCVQTAWHSIAVNVDSLISF